MMVSRVVIVDLSIQSSVRQPMSYRVSKLG